MEACTYTHVTDAFKASITADNINTFPSSLFSPLKRACAARKAAVVRHLLLHGADVNLACREGYAPIHTAVVFDSTNCLRVLIAAGARLNDATQETLFWSASTPLDMALRKHHHTCAKLLIGAGANANGMHAANKCVWRAVRAREQLRSAVCVVLKRRPFGMHRDVAVLIGQAIWALRFECVCQAYDE